MNQKETPSQTPKGLETLEKVTHLMDNAIRIPGTNFRFGLDALLGLLPGAGDTAGLVISGALLLAMIRHGVSSQLLVQMLGNILLDYLVGIVPLLGDLFDATFKANTRNLELLKAYYAQKPEHKKPPTFLRALGQIVLVAGLLAGILVGMAILGLFLLA